MKNIRDLHARIVLPAFMAAVLFFGCTTSKSKHGVKTNELQTASAQPVILMPVFILSPQDNGSTNGNDRLPLRDPTPPEQSIQGWPAPPPEPPAHL